MAHMSLAFSSPTAEAALRNHVFCTRDATICEVNFHLVLLELLLRCAALKVLAIEFHGPIPGNDLSKFKDKLSKAKWYVHATEVHYVSESSKVSGKMYFWHGIHETAIHSVPANFWDHLDSPALPVSMDSLLHAPFNYENFAISTFRSILASYELAYL